MTRVTSLIGNVCKIGTPLCIKTYNEPSIYVGRKTTANGHVMHCLVATTTCEGFSNMPMLRVEEKNSVSPINIGKDDHRRDCMERLRNSIHLIHLNVKKLPKLSVILVSDAYVIHLGGGLLVKFTPIMFGLDWSTITTQALGKMTLDNRKLVLLADKEKQDRVFKMILANTSNYRRNDIAHDYQMKRCKKQAKMCGNYSLIALSRYMMRKRLGMIREHSYQ